ncbi:MULTISPECIES: 30S ribosomal protein S1 [Pirellulaceae]|uniref:30S ribosomal protein S1 n=1 Tax=Stieleria magnilauensis TaxID=2527963 RepID=A0ABX5XX24_9BACT|nr:MULTISPECIES: 30S ribosomal protein S1 [Pirellulaceae]MCS7465734.1 30S ribosomal protein S1 [Stieleria sedimenti]PAY21621.1 30S ribosomal protein S1 [Rhodopirellula sp. SM50]QDV86568.1 30S ribosomal protein S1 [Planctomycetes bacterium TBK1r]
MVNRNLIRSLEDDDMLNDLAVLAPEEETEDWLLDFLQHAEQQDYAQGRIVDGKIVEINDEWALIDVGFKSEGTVNLNEWGPDEAKPAVGDTVQVLIEEMEDNYGAADDPYGMIALSKSKAEKIIEWEHIIKKIGEGQVVTGTVIRKIKGGLLVDIGVNVFLPGSQVDIRRPGDIGDFIGRVIQAEVLKIDDTRRNIVISRRSLIENQREEDRAYLMQELEVGQIRKGIVKNIADFGAFVDLGGIDGLLHITDMAWERISHPTEMVSIDQEIEVKVLHIDREKQKIALGLKQKDRNPWENIEEKYPVDSNHDGEVVNVMSYGAFVKLEPGIEGLVHISEMSWTKRVNHPSELVNIGDKIEVKILGVDPEGQQLSLGMKQTQKNPWDDVLERYPEGTDVTGKVRNLTNYGAFIELEEGIDGLLHVSDMSWTRKIGHPSELLEKGQELQCRVLSVDEQRRRIALGLKQLDNDPWDGDIPDKYQPGQLVKGNVTKITNFGVFIGLEDGLEGLLHISELAEHKVENPEEVVKVGDEIEVKVLRVDTDERKIGLSLKRVDWGEEQERAAAEAEAAETGSMPSQEGDLKGGLGSGEGPLFPTGG